jgi:ABC-type phosphate transport system auxiliary subunit
MLCLWGGAMHEKSAGVSQSVESLSPQERSRQYREMADGAFLKAQKTAKPELRAEYLALAMSWHAMAQELEADLGNLTQVEMSQRRLRGHSGEVGH